jgi:5-amino-6-(D-ribitylamino)uracil---L-tyrosine 4-hydroxyphenyl transferase
MPPETMSNPGNARSRRTRAALLDAGHDILREDGVEALTITAVAERAGVTRRALYLHFPTRAELIGAIYDHVAAAEGLAASLGQVWHAPTAAAALDQWASHLARYHTRVLAVDRAVQRTLCDDPDAVAHRARVSAEKLAGCQRLAGRLAGEGELAPGWTAGSASDMLYALSSSDVIEALTNDRGWSEEHLARHLTLLFRSAFTSQAKSPVPVRSDATHPGTGRPPRGIREWLDAAAAHPASLPDEGYVALLGTDGAELEELCELADALRREAAGDALTYVVNRNLDPAAVAGADPGSRKRLAELVAEARALGATEICLQGPLPADSDDDYLDLIAAIKESAPDIHLHGFRPAELLDGAARRGQPLAEFLVAARRAGLGSVPGTAARILDDDVRARMLGRPDVPVARWTEVIEAAHRAGLTSTSTMVFGHVESPAHQVAHLRHLAGIQDRTGGFTEFIAMPFVPAAAAVTAPGLVGTDVPGPPWRQSRALHAVARLMLHGRVANIQAAWPKYGLEPSVELLRGGANDIGGLLLDGQLAPDAGAEAGLALTRDDVTRVARELGRPLRRRTTTYGEVRDGE